MTGQLLRWQDLAVIGLYFAVVVVIGVICARKMKSAEKYFLAGRTMPGWVVGFSLMATIVSSLTFLAVPAFTFEHNWRHFPGNSMYLLAVFVALILFIPFYRKRRINSVYEYLERRFGLWARLYSAFCFVVFYIFRMGIILYVVCFPIQTMTGFSLPYIMFVFGFFVAVYTIAGGLEAVIWTDLLQGIALIMGGLICLPILVFHLPEGLGQIIHIGLTDDKFSIGSTAFNFSEKTVWVMLLTSVVVFLQWLGTDQTFVQRYCAAKSDKEASKAMIIGGFLTVPVWGYFFFIGTALYVFYTVIPDPALVNMKPAQILPYFILTQVPAGIAGFVISGLIAAAMSTLDSSINALAATVTNDFYRRLFVKNENELHYARIGRLFSVVFSIIMIGAAFTIHYSRSQEAVMDIQFMFSSILGGGLLSLFMLGFLTKKVDSRAALIATGLTVLGVAGWLFVKSQVGHEIFPSVSNVIPNNFWVGVFANLFLFIFAYAISFVTGKNKTKDLTDLTIWTKTKVAAEK